MTRNLLITESSAKSKRIAGFLGEGWRVEATRGPVCDLPQDTLGVEVNDDFRPQFEVPPRQANTVRRLLKAIRDAEAVYVATDPDREGETVTWHILQLADLPPDRPVYRVTFTALTEKAVKDAFESPRPLDVNLVDAQQARRIVDRLVGYLVSPLACQALEGRYSAGWVQRTCLRLVIERERAIAAFTAETYWTLAAHLKAEAGELTARLRTVKGQPYERLSRDQVEALTGGLKEAAFWIGAIQSGEQTRHRAPPFTTGTLLEVTCATLGLSPERTMQIAQRLYEAGQITYPRTEGVDVASDAQDATRRHIAQALGGDYLPDQPPVYPAQVRHIQEAHEAIRPTDLTRVPEQIEGDGAALYALIWRRFVASQMVPARYAVQNVEVLAGKTHGQPYPLTFEARGKTLSFDGFLTLYQEPPDPDAEAEQERALPSLQEGEAVRLVAWLADERQTQAPPRFTEASLVRELERLGIGRPSTCASTIQAPQQREYVVLRDQRLVPTSTGIMLCDFLDAQFPDLFSAPYTARLEDALDAVARGEFTRLEMLKTFWADFAPQLSAAGQAAQQGAESRCPSPTPTGETCPVCGGELVERHGTYGPFLGCAHYPSCNYTRGLEHQPVTFQPADRTGEHEP